jgi:hypothetical protein
MAFGKSRIPGKEPDRVALMSVWPKAGSGRRFVLDKRLSG